MRRIGTAQVQDYEKEHISRMRRLAPECAVLLKSKGDFPLEKPEKIALFGNGARQTVKGGTGSGDIVVRKLISIEEGLETAGFTVTTKPWLDAYDQIRREAETTFVEIIKERAAEKGIPAALESMGAVMPEPEYSLELLGEGECCIYVLARISGEGGDRQAVPGDYELTETEKRSILSLAKAYPKFLLVLNVGGPVDITPVMEVENVLLLSQLGTVTGDVLADIVLGKSYPSGRLTATWAPLVDFAQIGDFAARDDVRYKEGIYVGYRYFEAAGINSLFPFGYGLDYTEFSINCIGIRMENNVLYVSSCVKNIGDFPGKETVQLYYSAPWGRLDKPVKELGAFQKTGELRPGGEERIELALPVENMASYDAERARWILEEGYYVLRIGRNAVDTRVCGIVKLSGDVETARAHHYCVGADFEDWKPDTPGQEGCQDVPVIEMEASSVAQLGHYDRYYQSSDANCKSSREQDESIVETLESSLDLSELTLEEKVNVCIGRYAEGAGPGSIIGNAAFSVAGAAGETYTAFEKTGIRNLVLADGPAGMRLSPEYYLEEGMPHAKEAEPTENYLALFPERIQKMILAEWSAALEAIKGKTIYYQYGTAIPIGVALAQSWNLGLCQECGHMIAEEMKLFGVQIWLTPALNIMRHPLCGRNFEYYSEDPLISGRVAAAVTKGVQSVPGCAVSVKHFVCNNQETNRFRNNSIVGERALRELYLKGFEIAVKEANPYTIMSSLNLLNGVHTCNRKDLLTGILREEWGFRGIVMTDWSVTSDAFFGQERYPHASAAECIAAGNDLIMPGSSSDRETILKALSGENKREKLSIEQLEVCVMRLLSLAHRLRS